VGLEPTTYCLEVIVRKIPAPRDQPLPNCNPTVMCYFSRPLDNRPPPPYHEPPRRFGPQHPRFWPPAGPTPLPKTLPPLTIAEINAAIRTRLPAQRLELRDGACPGLVLRAGPTSTLWTLQVRTAPGQPRRRYEIGPYPQITLAVARRLAAHKRDEAKSYPSSSPSDSSSGSPLTLSELVATYGSTNGSLQPSWYDADKRIRHVLAALLATPLARLTLPTLQRTIDAHPSRSSAAACVRYVRPVLRWGRKRGYLSLDARDLEQPKRSNVVRERVLSDDELRAVLTELTHAGHDAAVRIMLLTACRREEICGARWDEFALGGAHGEGGEAALWTIPRERTKQKRAHVVPLSSEAVRVLGLVREQDVREHTEGRACQGVRLWDGRLAGRNGNWDRYQKKLFERTDTAGWHRHDLRRTAATILGRSGVAPHIVEVVLGHTTAHSRIASVYNKSRYQKEHRDAMELLARYYCKLLSLRNI